MKIENGIYAGTKDEFIDFIANEIFTDCKKKESEFKGYDFGSVITNGVDESTNLKELYDYASFWCGVKSIPDYFNSFANRQFITDLYNGGYFGVCDIYTDDMDFAYVRREAEKMLKECLDNSDNTIIWEASK